jgi:hypothetical protein
MKVSKVVLGILLGLAACMPACSGQCPFPENADAATLISYLDERQSREQNACIDKSFEKLNGRLPNSDLTDEQVKVLIRFLDHQRLPTASEREGFVTHLSPEYPATTSLMLIGRRASNLLLSAMSSPNTPRFRKSAAFAWSLIHRDDPSSGVQALVQAASAQNNSEQANNLRDAAVSVAQNCPANVRQKCDSELPR